MPQTVRVKAKHIRHGEPGSCFSCALALALQDATGDDQANVWVDWGLMRVEVWHRSVLLDVDTRQFVWDFDDLPRTKGPLSRNGLRPVRVELPKRLAGTRFAPFSFTVPDPDDPEWEEKCYGCEQLGDPKELDDEGYCPECTRAQPE